MIQVASTFLKIKKIISERPVEKTEMSVTFSFQCSSQTLSLSILGKKRALKIERNKIKK